MIGVIGGNGVAATNKLCQLVEEKLTMNGAFRDAHHPEMLVWQATLAPSRSMYLEGRGPSWIEDYVVIGRKLKDCGCTKLCMCCNTAHYAIDILEDQIGIPFINLLDSVAEKCKSLGAKRVGMMCSDGLRKVGLYEKRFALVAPGVELVYPDSEHQDMVTQGICNAKNNKRYLPIDNEDNPANLFGRVVKYLQELGVDIVVSGCTDIHNVYYPEEAMNHYVDSLDVLANKIVDLYLKKEI